MAKNPTFYKRINFRACRLQSLKNENTYKQNTDKQGTMHP